MFMYMISHNASNQMLQKAFQHSGETIHRKIYEVFDIVPALTHRFVKLPSSSQTHTKIATDYRFMPFFQVCYQFQTHNLLNCFPFIANLPHDLNIFPYSFPCRTTLVQSTTHIYPSP
jgi:hypothetical protein